MVFRSAPGSRGQRFALVCGGLLVLAVIGFFLRGRVDVEGLFAHAFAIVRQVGIVPFFAAMAVLPALGFPLLAFSLSAGPVFGPEHGLLLVSVLVVLSITINIALTYWLARYTFRPLLGRLMTRFGYRLPQVAAEDKLSLTILIRITPGPPFFVQSYLLGLAEVPFGIYMTVSCIIANAYAVALVYFGDALANGRGKMAVFAISLLVAITAAVHLLRRRLSRKKVVSPV